MSLDLGLSWKIFVNNLDLFWYGIKITILFAVVGTVCGFLIGLLVGAIRTIEVTEYDNVFTKAIKYVLKGIASFYVWVFRGTPMVIQAVFIYYFLYPVLKWTPITAGLIIISINTGAYMAEIVRSGIQSVDKGQTEACKSIGMNTVQTNLFVIFPQAIKNSFPSIGNQLIVNLKDSSMLNSIAVTELYFQTTSIVGSTLKYPETYFVSLVLYLILTSICTLILNAIEKKMALNTTHREHCC